MNVLFVHTEQDPYSPDKPLEVLERVQFGISYISSVLKKEGHHTRLAVLCDETVHTIDDHIRTSTPALSVSPPSSPNTTSSSRSRRG